MRERERENKEGALCSPLHRPTRMRDCRARYILLQLCTHIRAISRLVNYEVDRGRGWGWGEDGPRYGVAVKVAASGSRPCSGRLHCALVRQGYDGRVA